MSEGLDLGRLRELANEVQALLDDPGIVYSTFPGCRPWMGDAEFIRALEPTTVLALLDALDDANARLAAVEELAQSWKAHPRPNHGWNSGLSAIEAGTRLGAWNVLQKYADEVLVAHHADPSQESA